MNDPRGEAVDDPVEVLRGYSLIADGERGALIGPRGDLSWLCVPQWHDDAVFSSLIGGRGTYLLTPATNRFVSGGSYEPGSLIWAGRWVTSDAVIQTREALAMPADRHAAVLLRRVRAVQGTARVHLSLDARPGFGMHGLSQAHRADDGTWTARAGGLWLRLRGAGLATIAGGSLTCELEVPQGQHADLVLELSDCDLAAPTPVDELWESTADTWASVVPNLDHCAAPRDAAIACAVLRGMTSSSGGMVAAATTSLPERSESRRSYDYRYVWLRDLCYGANAAAAAGMQPLFAQLVQFAVARLLDDGERIQPASLVDGGRVPDERHLERLQGYPGGRDIVGNWVNNQFQLDTVGELLQLFSLAAQRDCLDADGRRAMRLAVSVIRKRWREPEAGVWELEDDWWTHSRLACIAGLRSAAVVHSSHDAVQLRGLADAVLAETSRRCLHADGWWRRSPTRDGTDAALLMPPVRAALAADDPRTRATLAAVKRELADDYYIYRYAHPGRDLGDAEGAFLLCGFMTCLAELAQGNRVEAMRWFERNRAACGSPGLFTEEYDIQQRQLRGNIPQTFVHAAMLEAAVRLAS